MIFSAETPPTFRDELPAAVDVVVIGGGVIGISTALYLARQNISVLVCEKGRVAGEQSSRNWGWIRQQARDPAELPIVIDSINSWETLSRELDDDIGFTRQGVLYAAQNEQQLSEYEQWLEVADQHQVDTRMVSGGHIDTLVRDKRTMVGRHADPQRWPCGAMESSAGTRQTGTQPWWLNQGTMCCARG